MGTVVENMIYQCLGYNISVSFVALPWYGTFDNMFFYEELFFFFKMEKHDQYQSKKQTVTLSVSLFDLF